MSHNNRPQSSRGQCAGQDARAVGHRVRRVVEQINVMNERVHSWLNEEKQKQKHVQQQRREEDARCAQDVVRRAVEDRRRRNGG